MNLRNLCAGLVFLAAANAAQAIYTINIDQVGADVVMSGSGSVDTSSMAGGFPIGACFLGDGLINTNTICIGTETSSDWYPGALTPGLSMPAPGGLGGSSSSGPGLYIIGTELYMPDSYVSGSPIINRTTFAGTTLAAIGLTVGTQTLLVPSGDEIIINIGLAPPPVVPATPASIPTLSEYALLAMASLMGMLGIAALRRKRG